MWKFGEFGTFGGDAVVFLTFSFFTFFGGVESNSRAVNRGEKGLWNLREAINLHYKKHILLLLLAVGYSVCYSMVVVSEIRDELKDLRQRVGINPGSLDCSGSGLGK